MAIVYPKIPIFPFTSYLLIDKVLSCPEGIELNWGADLIIYNGSEVLTLGKDIYAIPWVMI
jgi:hypothetical protein